MIRRLVALTIGTLVLVMLTGVTIAQERAVGPITLPKRFLTVGN